MPINRYYLKLDAKTRIARSRPNAIVVGLIAVGILMLLEMLVPSVLGLNKLPFELPETITSYDAYEAAMEQMTEQMTRFLESYRPSALGMVLALALELMHALVSVGFSVYALHVSRGEKADYGNLLDGFTMFWRVIALLLLESILVFLQLLLLVVPGVIAAYRYRQALYLLIEHPEYSPVRCLKESAALMRGHKAELFVLDLSFLGWLILQWMVPFVAVWTLPYREITYTSYYCLLTGPRTAPDGKPFTDAQFTDLPDE